MPGGNKKKKTKPVANPARGFATTSVASKPKVESTAELSSKEASAIVTPAENDVAPTSPEALSSSRDEAPAPSRELHELSPEEFEAQLEASELQQFVERYAAKVKKETARQVFRLQTDKRLYRGQADFLSMKEWLPEELMQHILDLTLADWHRDNEASKSSKLPHGDDLTIKVWQLRQCLLDLALPFTRIQEAVGWVVSRPPTNTSSTSVWGLDEALEWFALHCEPNELEEYDYTRQRAVADAPGRERTSVPGGKSHKKRPPAVSRGNVSRENGDAHIRSASTEDDVEISELESDLEPEGLLDVYLRTKIRLYELNPGKSSGPPGKGRSKATKAHPRSATKSAGERRLEQKLQKIESDVLFDKREADAHWAGQKIQLDREAAERRKLQLVQATNDKPSTASHSPADVNDEAERIGQEMLREDADGDGEMLGGMFDALPGVQPSDSSAVDNGAQITIRDFGKPTGMNPKRVLEEACRSRNSRCKIVYEQVSQTTYSCRHRVSILWTKEQDLVDDSYLPMIAADQTPFHFKVTATQVATSDVAQSESFIATAALFLIFSGSPKEEKAHLRLPAAFRDLWDEFVIARQTHLHAADGEYVKKVRELIEKHRSPDDEEEDEVVFNANMRRRLDGSSVNSMPVSRTGTPNPHGPPEISQELQQMWLRKTSMPSYQRMLVGRMNLPMFHFRDAALDTIHRNQVTILCGETGCGKSTQLPAFILEEELSNGRRCKIYCTEPRRISAVSLAQRVSEEMGENKGDVGTIRSLVGYAIRLESHTTAQTRLVYATVGIVLRMLENSDGLSDITHLVIDEVHERSIDTDFLLIVLQSLMIKRSDLKVILMSATVDAQRFSHYLNGAPIINVPGRTFPVEAKFLEDAIELTGHTNEDAAQNAVDEESAEDDAAPKEDGEKQQVQGYSKRTQNTLANYDEYRIDYSLIVKLIEKVGYMPQYEPFSKAVLVFLPGIAEIRQLNDMLGGHPRFQRGWRVHPLHSTFSSEDQQAAFEVPPDGIRKIVLATNIAETGITIPDVTCVIDTGKHKEMRFDERRQMSRLIQSFIARANAKQRRGRAGRVQQGICFHLFTRYRHDHLMVEQQMPEMLRLSLQDLVMRVKICKLGDVEHALSQALDPPSARNIRRAIDALVEVGALTEKEELTPLGSQLAKLPLDAQLGKLILLGSSFGCLDFCLTVAATLSAKSPFLSPMHQKKAADTVRLGFKRGDSDLLTVYNAYCVWRKVCSTQGLSEYQFCNKNFLSPQNLGNIEDLKAQLLTSLVDAGFVQLGPEEKHALSKMRYNQRHRNFVALPAQYGRADDNDALATSVVAWSFYPKIIKQDGKGWRNIANNQSLGLHPTSVNKVSLAPDVKYLSFYGIMQSAARFTNAQETSPVAEIPLLLGAGEAIFHMYAGVIVVDGNRLRFKVRDWRTMIVLKTLRAKIREVMGKLFRSPGRDLGDRPRRWMDALERIFDRQRVLHPPLPPSMLR